MGAPPDELSLAAAQAARTGVRVEVASETTETSVTFVLPDGSRQVEAAAGPIRVRKDGAWVPVDTTLRVTADGVRPVAVPGERRFSAGGQGPMARLGAGGGGDARSLEFGWVGSLPAPVLSGDTATYPDVLPGVDLVLTATRKGFS